MDAHDPQSQLGTIAAEKYRMRALIGRGSMGFVYDVEDVTTGELGALKVLLPELGANPEVSARLVREGKTMNLLAHRNIVRLVDAGCLSNGTPFVVTELVNGASLRAIMDAGPVEPARALAIVHQILEALDHAHGHGVIHRDVKPDNVMIQTDELTGEEVVKVLDFGVAKLVDDTRKLLCEVNLTQVGFELFGSPLYVAPEVVLGNPVDARADVYSAGVVLFELLAGAPPFDDPDPVALVRMHAAAAPPRLAERAPARSFTPELEVLVADALAKDPARRFASAGQMIAAVDTAARAMRIDDPTATAMSPPPVVARAHTPPSVAPPRAVRKAVTSWIRAHKRAAILAACGASVVVVLAAVSLLSGHRSKPGASLPGHASAGTPTTGLTDSSALLARAQAEFRRGALLDAVSDYEQALAQDGNLGSDADLRSNLTKIASGKDAVPAVIALDLLARGVAPPAQDVIRTQAVKNPSHDVRQRALAIAIRDGFAEGIDRVEASLIDLQQAKTCDERRAAIAKLRELGDRRAIAPLRRVKTQFPCIDRDAADALAALDPQQ